MTTDINEKLRKICHARKTQRRNARGDTFIFGSKDLDAFRTTFLTPLYRIDDKNLPNRWIETAFTIAYANTISLPHTA